jgi:malonate-semialdehyde dehydrogenase (acetylating)/methylmalonate-semialdehyde dehydrogenase
VEKSKNIGPNIDAGRTFQTLSVVSGIAPFNFPEMVLL